MFAFVCDVISALRGDLIEDRSLLAEPHEEGLYSDETDEAGRAHIKQEPGDDGTLRPLSVGCCSLFIDDVVDRL
jgi:hypothetical protein